MLISMRRRSQTDALAPVNAPRWLVVRDRLSRVVQSDALQPLRGICGPRCRPSARVGPHAPCVQVPRARYPNESRAPIADAQSGC